VGLIRPPATAPANVGLFTAGNPVFGPPFAPTRRPNCVSDCMAACPGGTGTLCQEVNRVPPNTFARICACVCPPQTRCNLLQKIIRLWPLLVLKKIWKALYLKYISVLKGIYLIALGSYFLLKVLTILAWYSFLSLITANLYRQYFGDSGTILEVVGEIG